MKLTLPYDGIIETKNMKKRIKSKRSNREGHSVALKQIESKMENESESKGEEKNEGVANSDIDVNKLVEIDVEVEIGVEEENDEEYEEEEVEKEGEKDESEISLWKCLTVVRVDKSTYIAQDVSTDLDQNAWTGEQDEEEHSMDLEYGGEVVNEVVNEVVQKIMTYGSRSFYWNEFSRKIQV